MRKLTERQKRDIKAIAAKRDEDIIFSDAPSVPDWEWGGNRQVLPAKRKPVAMRLDSDVIAWLKADGRGCQTKANWLLRSAMEHFRKEAGLAQRMAVARRHNVRGAEATVKTGAAGGT